MLLVGSRHLKGRQAARIATVKKRRECEAKLNEAPAGKIRVGCFVQEEKVPFDT